MARKLKGFNFKSLILKHGEKLMLGVVGLLVVVAFMGAKWAPFKPKPRDITDAVERGEKKLQAKTWPDDLKKEFEVDPNASVEQLVAGIRQQVDPTPYEYTESFLFDLYGTTSPITEPELHPVKSLIASGDRRVILINPNPIYSDSFTDEEFAAATPDAEAPIVDEEADIPDAFKTPDRGFNPGTQFGQAGNFPGGIPDIDGFGLAAGRGGRSTTRPGSPGTTTRPGSSATRPGTGATRPGSGLARGGTGRGLGTQPGMMGSRRGGASALVGLSIGASEDDMMDFMGGAGGLGRGGMSGAEGRGVRYVAVRGVLPLKDQIRKIKKASNVSTLDAEQLYQIIDFELERQKMRERSDDPWGDDWEKVDIEVSKKVLREAADFEAENHEGQITDSAITGPLPMLAMGVWGDHATHPQVKEWQLDEEEIKLEMEIQQRLLKQHLEYEKNMPEELVQKKGFSDLIGDTRSLYGSMRGVGRGIADDYDDDGGMMGFGMGNRGSFSRGGVAGAFGRLDDTQKFLDDIKKATDDEERNKLLLKYVQDHVGITGEVLLFRYLDFDVEPGATYRYRVRLEVTNPNYGRRSSEAAGLAEVVQGQTRKTDWSNITEPTRVPDDVDYFLDDLALRGGERLEATMTVFEWDPEVGTTVADQALKVELGEEIGGFSKTYVLDPAKERFEIQDYEFQSGDIVVDALQAGTVDPNQHPDLQLPASARRRDLGVSNQALVMRPNGFLTTLDQKSRAGAKADRAKALAWEQRNYEDIKGLEAKQSGSALTQNADSFGLYGGMGIDDEDGGGARGKDRKSQYRNMMRRGGGGRGAVETPY